MNTKKAFECFNNTAIDRGSSIETSFLTVAPIKCALIWQTIERIADFADPFTKWMCYAWLVTVEEEK